MVVATNTPVRLKVTERAVATEGAVLPPPGSAPIAIFPGTGAGSDIGRGVTEQIQGLVGQLYGRIRSGEAPIQAIGGETSSGGGQVSDMRERGLGEKISDLFGRLKKAAGYGDPEPAAEWNPKVGGTEKIYQNDNLEGKATKFKYKHVEANEGRPDVYYCPPEMIKAVARDMYLNNGAPPEVANERAQFPKAFFTPVNPLKPEGGAAIFLPLPEPGDKNAKIDWGSAIRHEHIHWKGGGEGTAYKGQQDYIERNGGSPTLKTVGAIIEHIAQNYNPAATENAFKELYKKTVGSKSDTEDLFKTVSRLAETAENFTRFVKSSLGADFDSRAEGLTDKYRPKPEKSPVEGEMQMFSAR